MTRSDNPPVIDGIEDLVLVGEGGFAVVYRGHQPAFRRDVAVKVLQRSGLDERDRGRFDRECQAMGALSDHPGIVTLYDAGFTEDERPYLVMAYVANGTLGDTIAQNGPLSWQEVTDLGVRLSGALETAHRAGVLHRDIKPANILRARYGDQLSDFGIARIQGGHETRSGVITASIAHAAPEILDGRAPTPQADIYSLASTLYEALTGRAAFVGDSDEGLLPLIRRVVSDQPPDLREHGVPGVIAALIETAMAKEAQQRYASAEALGLALRGAQAVLGIHVADLVIVGTPGASPASANGASIAPLVDPTRDPPEPPPPETLSPEPPAPEPPAPEPPASEPSAPEPSAPEPPDGSGRTIVVDPPPHAPGQPDEPPPPEGPEAGPGPVGDDGTPPHEPPADEPASGVDVPPPAAAFAPTTTPSRGRKKPALIAGGLLGGIALVFGVVLITGDDADAPEPPLATGTPTTAEVTPTTESSTSDTTSGTTIDTGQPATTLEPSATTEPTADSTGGPVAPGDAGVGVLAFAVGPQHPLIASLTQTAADLGVEIGLSDPSGQPADELFELISDGHNPIIVLAQDPTGETVAAITDSAAAHPEVTYVVIDAVVDAPNVSSTSFADHEGSFMAGTIAALASTTGRVGFIGGIDNLRIRRYEAGFVAGARRVDPLVQVDVRYFPGDGARVNDQGLERETATAMFELGADVIYHAGTAGTGLYQAAAAAPGRWAIGSDTDRAATAAPALRDSILTSTVKSYASVAADALRRSLDGDVEAGLTSVGLADEGLTWATTGGNVDAIAAEIDAAAELVKAGDIDVPSLVDGRVLAPLGPDCPSEGCFARMLGAEIVGAELSVTIEANWFMDVEGNHVHYFWSPRYDTDQVGVDSAERFGVEVGEWDIDDRYPVYVTEEVVSLSRRTVEDTRLCVTPADASHNVIDPELFDCLLFQS